MPEYQHTHLSISIYIYYVSTTWDSSRQAEFRSYHIWTHPIMMKYKYMIWLDTDCALSKEWDVDPMRAMVENDLAVLFVGYPYGKTKKDNDLRDKMIRFYNTSLCSVSSGKDGPGIHLWGNMCKSDLELYQVAGNHHITNLEVFRKPVHQQFLKAFTGDYRFSRMYDDQMAVTIVGLMEQYMVNNYTSGRPEKYKIWHERTNGIKLDIAHHGMFDADESDRAPVNKKNSFRKYKKTWHGLDERCGSHF